MRRCEFLGFLLLLVLLTGCAASLPDRPDPPHHYFQHADRYLTISDPQLYAKPLRVRYKQVGKGRPLLLVHGLQTSSYSWRYNLEELGRRGRAIALDLVGSGLSDHPSDFLYTPHRMAVFLEAFRRELAKREPGLEQWDIVGNSLGGAYAAAYAAQYPERVRKLVIIHAPGFVDEAPIYTLELLRSGQLPEWTSRFFGEWMVREYQRYHRPGILSEEEVAQYSLPYRDADGKLSFWHIVREGLGPEVAGSLEGRLKTIRTPTLLIWAENDELIPAWTGYRWQNAIRGSRLVWIPQSSHFPHVEAPAMTMQHIRAFLDEDAQPAPTCRNP